VRGKFVRFVHPPRLKFDFIRTKADEFRQRYVNPPDLLPIPIVEIVELMKSKNAILGHPRTGSTFMRTSWKRT
jgi:hypothetical protein